jgi:hypothetical protein
MLESWQVAVLHAASRCKSSVLGADCGGSVRRLHTPQRQLGARVALGSTMGLPALHSLLAGVALPAHVSYQLGGGLRDCQGRDHLHRHFRCTWHGGSRGCNTGAALFSASLVDLGAVTAKTAAAENACELKPQRQPAQEPASGLMLTSALPLRMLSLSSSTHQLLQWRGHARVELRQAALPTRIAFASDTPLAAMWGRSSAQQV